MSEEQSESEIDANSSSAEPPEPANSASTSTIDDDGLIMLMKRSLEAKKSLSTRECQSFVDRIIEVLSSYSSLHTNPVETEDQDDQSNEENEHEDDEELSPNVSDNQVVKLSNIQLKMLKWLGIVDHDLVSNIENRTHQIQWDDLNFSKLRDSFKSDKYCLQHLSQYIEDTTFKKLDAMNSTKKKKKWNCPKCDTARQIQSIQCDDCKAWFHFECVDIEEAPPEESNWYCSDCEEN